MTVIDVPLSAAGNVVVDDAVLVIPSLPHFKAVATHAPHLLGARLLLPLLADVALQLAVVGIPVVPYWELLGEESGDRQTCANQSFWEKLDHSLSGPARDLPRICSYGFRLFTQQVAITSEVMERFLADHPEIRTVIVPTWNFTRAAQAELPSDVGAAVAAHQAVLTGRFVVNAIMPDWQTPPPLHQAGMGGNLGPRLKAIAHYQRHNPRRAGRLRVALDVTWVYRPVQVAQALREQGIETVFVLHGPSQPHHGLGVLDNWGPVFKITRPDEGIADPRWIAFAEALPAEEEGDLFANPFLKSNYLFHAGRHWPALAALGQATRDVAKALDVDAWLLSAIDTPSGRIVFNALGEAGARRILLPHGVPFQPDPFFADAEGVGFWSRRDADAFPVVRRNAVKRVTGHLEPVEQALPDVATLRERLGLPTDRKVVLLLSSAVRLGDVPQLHFGRHLDAVQTLLGEVPDGFHVAVRPKPYWDDPQFYPTLLRLLGDPPAVSILNGRYEGSDLFEQMAAADVVVTLNTFSTALLDAVRLGRPALCLGDVMGASHWPEIFPRVDGLGDFWTALAAAVADSSLAERQCQAIVGLREDGKDYAAELGALVRAVVA